MLDSQSEPIDSPDSGGDNRKTTETSDRDGNDKTETLSEQIHSTSTLKTVSHSDREDGDEPPEERPITLKRR